MTEAEVIQRTSLPQTRAALGKALVGLGVQPGMTLLVHSSLSALGWVCGGAVTVVQALLDSLGTNGTLVMPTHTSHLSDPAYWGNPAVPTNWWPIIRESLPPFDPQTTPTWEMGAIPEAMRQWPACRRSQHPQWSFAALGPQAEEVTANHQFRNGLGEGSPLARIYDLDGAVLLIGVGHARNTSLHLAEYRRPSPLGKPICNGAPVLRDGVRQWIEILDIELHDGDFERVGAAFQNATSTYRTAQIGEASVSLMPQRPLVDFATQWFAENR